MELLPLLIIIALLIVIVVILCISLIIVTYRTREREKAYMAFKPAIEKSLKSIEADFEKLREILSKIKENLLKEDSMREEIHKKLLQMQDLLEKTKKEYQ